MFQVFLSLAAIEVSVQLLVGVTISSWWNNRYQTDCPYHKMITVYYLVGSLSLPLLVILSKGGEIVMMISTYIYILSKPYTQYGVIIMMRKGNSIFRHVPDPHAHPNFT